MMAMCKTRLDETCAKHGVGRDDGIYSLICKHKLNTKHIILGNRKYLCSSDNLNYMCTHVLFNTKTNFISQENSESFPIRPFVSLVLKKVPFKRNVRNAKFEDLYVINERSLVTINYV